MYNCDGFPLILEYILLAGVLVAIFRNLRRNRFDYGVFILIILAGLVNAFEKLSTGCVFDPFDFFGLFQFNWRDAVVTAGTLILIVRKVSER